MENLSKIGDSVINTVLTDPFAHVIFNVDPLPHQINFDYIQYFFSTFIFSPVVTITSAFLLSVYTGEWWELKSLAHEFNLSVKTMLFASPVISLLLKLIFECRIGYLTYDSNGIFYDFFLAPLGYLLLSDAYFYWTHRLWHIPMIYEMSHKIHHSCRPTTSFAAVAADVLEVLVSGHGSTIFPVLVISINSKVYLGMILFTELWTVFIHNSKGYTVFKFTNDSWLHSIHHHYGQKNYNFSLFFKFWDVAMGTYKSESVLCKRLQKD